MSYNELTNMNIFQTYQIWLNSIKILPEKKNRAKTFMDIAGIRHRENSWSEIYAYYFSSGEKHGFGSLFIDSLTELIAEKSGTERLVFENFVVRREVVTKDNKRIDLVITDGDHAIIVENKVYAWLYNDLASYWDDLGHIEDYNKRGVVLSLFPVNVGEKDDRYVNITHEELSHRIENNISDHYIHAEAKSILFLQDFMQNIYNLTHSMNNEELNFFYENDHNKIIRMAEIYHNVREYLANAIEDADKVVPLLESEGLSLTIIKKQHLHHAYYAFKGYNGNVMITLVYDSLWNYRDNGCRIQAILELQGKVLVWATDQQKRLEEKLGISVNSKNIKNNSFWHFYIDSLPFDPKTDLGDNFQMILVEKLKHSCLYEMGMQIINLFQEDKK